MFDKGLEVPIPTGDSLSGDAIPFCRGTQDLSNLGEKAGFRTRIMVPQFQETSAPFLKGTWRRTTTRARAYYYLLLGKHKVYHIMLAILEGCVWAARGIEETLGSSYRILLFGQKEKYETAVVFQQLLCWLFMARLCVAWGACVGLCLFRGFCLLAMLFLVALDSTCFY